MHFWRLQTNSTTGSFLQFKTIWKGHYGFPYSEGAAGHSGHSFFIIRKAKKWDWGNTNKTQCKLHTNLSIPNKKTPCDQVLSHKIHVLVTTNMLFEAKKTLFKIFGIWHKFRQKGIEVTWSLAGEEHRSHKLSYIFFQTLFLQHIPTVLALDKQQNLRK